MIGQKKRQFLLDAKHRQKDNWKKIIFSLDQ